MAQKNSTSRKSSAVVVTPRGMTISSKLIDGLNLSETDLGFTHFCESCNLSLPAMPTKAEAVEVWLLHTAVNHAADLPKRGYKKEELKGLLESEKPEAISGDDFGFTDEPTVTVVPPEPPAAIEPEPTMVDDQYSEAEGLAKFIQAMSMRIALPSLSEADALLAASEKKDAAYARNCVTLFRIREENEALLVTIQEDCTTASVRQARATVLGDMVAAAKYGEKIAEFKVRATEAMLKIADAMSFPRAYTRGKKEMATLEANKAAQIAIQADMDRIALVKKSDEAKAKAQAKVEAEKQWTKRFDMLLNGSQAVEDKNGNAVWLFDRLGPYFTQTRTGRKNAAKAAHTGEAKFSTQGWYENNDQLLAWNVADTVLDGYFPPNAVSADTWISWCDRVASALVRLNKAAIRAMLLTPEPHTYSTYATIAAASPANTYGKGVVAGPANPDFDVLPYRGPNSKKNGNANTIGSFVKPDGNPNMSHEPRIKNAARGA